MPSVIAVVPGDRLIIRIFQYWTSNPVLKWTTTYEYVARGSGGTPELRNTVDQLVAMHRPVQGPHVMIERATVSTWTPDSIPYNPLAFVTFELNLPGTRSGIGDPMPAEMAVHVKKNTFSGRLGKFFIRGGLYETDVTSASGIALFANQTWPQNFTAAVTASGVGQHLYGGTWWLRMCKITRTGSYLLDVTSLIVNRPATVNMNHDYFDRGAQFEAADVEEPTDLTWTASAGGDETAVPELDPEWS